MWDFKEFRGAHRAINISLIKVMSLIDYVLKRFKLTNLEKHGYQSYDSYNQVLVVIVPGPAAGYSKHWKSLVIP